MTLYKQREALSKVNGKLQWFKERATNASKKIKLLQAKLNDKPLSYRRLGPSESLERAKSSRSPRNTAIVNGVIVFPSPKRDKSKSTADYFEKYVVERTKNERIVANLKRLGINIDPNELYKQVPEEQNR
jgi:hypothetical protein